jgi:hypothetical protein
LDLPHYNTFFNTVFAEMGYEVVYQPSCLQQPYDQQCWPIRYPMVTWKENTLVIMHCQDFVSIKHGTCPEINAIEKYFGDKCKQVVVVHWNIDLDKIYDGDLNLMYFPTHSYELLCNLNKNKEQWLPAMDKHRQYNWQSLNGIPRAHRKLIARHLHKHFSQGVLSLGSEIPLPAWPYSTYFGCENETNWERLRDVYSSCSINVVTETQYTECPGIITEKTLMAFLAKQIPIVIGYQGIVQHCADLGFDMFRQIVDTTYDNERDDVRWRMAIDKNRNLLQNGVDRSKLESRLTANQQHVLNLPNIWLEKFNDKAKATFPNLCTN